MSFGVRVLVCVAAYGIVGWLVILGLAAGDPWMVGLSVGLLLPLVPRAWRRRTAIAFLAYVLAAGVIGPMWAWMGVLLFVPLYLEAPRPGLVFGAEIDEAPAVDGGVLQDEGAGADGVDALVPQGRIANVEEPAIGSALFPFADDAVFESVHHDIGPLDTDAAVVVGVPRLGAVGDGGKPSPGESQRLLVEGAGSNLSDLVEIPDNR